MTNSQQGRTLQRSRTTLSGPQVLASAKEFFARRSGIYAAFLEREGPAFITLRGQGGEEIAIGVAVAGTGTDVTATSYLFDQQVARFLASLPRVEDEIGVTDGGRPVNA